MLQNSFQSTLLEAGCDEAGRGCFAGPVFAAAVILPQTFHHPLLNDSKKVKEKDRIVLRAFIEDSALAYAVAMVDNIEIDKINILQASFRAMHLAIEKLTLQPQFLSIDGNRFKSYKNIPHQTIVKGDGKYANIAAASILAKTYRDEFMNKLSKRFPLYDWQNNKGYGTLKHRQAIEKYGITQFHRKSFNIVPTQMVIFK